MDKEREQLQDNDKLMDYTREIKKSWGETIKEYAAKGADIGGNIGGIFGSAGEAIGRAVGGFIGGAVAVVKGFFGGGLFGW